jgi:hypothetical protein
MESDFPIGWVIIDICIWQEGYWHQDSSIPFKEAIVLSVYNLVEM